MLGWKKVIMKKHSKVKFTGTCMIPESVKHNLCVKLYHLLVISEFIPWIYFDRSTNLGSQRWKSIAWISRIRLQISCISKMFIKMLIKMFWIMDGSPWTWKLSFPAISGSKRYHYKQVNYMHHQQNLCCTPFSFFVILFFF